MINTVVQRLFAVLGILVLAVSMLLEPRLPHVKAPVDQSKPRPIYHAQVEEENYEIPYTAVEQKDAKLPRGTRLVVQPGSLGKGQRTFRTYTKDGQQYNKVILSSTVTTPSQPRLVKVGTGPIRKSKVALAEGKPISRGEGGKTFTVVATAYTHTGNRTATGTWPQKGTIAVDPRVIPLGTKVYVEGYGPAVAADTGGAIKGAKIDVFLDTRSQCFAWGRRQVSITDLP